MNNSVKWKICVHAASFFQLVFFFCSFFSVAFSGIFATKQLLQDENYFLLLCGCTCICVLPASASGCPTCFVMCGGYQHFGLIFNVNDRHSGRCCGRVDDAPCEHQVVRWSRWGQCSRRSCWWRLAMQIRLPGNRNCLCRSNMQGTLWMLFAPCSAAFWIYAAVFVHSLLGNALAANQRKPIIEIIIVKICRLSTESLSRQ